MRFRHRILSAAALGLVSASCGGHSLEVGSTDGGATDVEVAPDVNRFADADPYAPEVWVGHFVNHQLQDGSDMLTLTVQFAQDGTVTGALLLGDGAILAPPTDPNVSYPPYTTYFSVTAVEGFPYTIRDGTKSGSTVTLRVLENETWSQWCALQTSYPKPDGGGALEFPYLCNPPGNIEVNPTGCSLTDPATMKTMPVDCNKYILCNYVCQCTATGCSLNLSANRPEYLGLSLVLTGDVATGTTSGPFGSYAADFKRTE
jgi:hypothetical protein